MVRKRGSVLMLAVIFSLIMCLLGYGVMYLFTQKYLSNFRELLDAKALLLSDAGLEMGREFLYFCDARLEDQADMDCAGGGALRNQVVSFMRPNPSASTWYGRYYGNGTYPVTYEKHIDESWPRSFCKIFISSATDNMSRTDGVYQYFIDTRAEAYPVWKDGTLLVGRDTRVLVEISSITFDNAHPPAPTSPWASWPRCDVDHCEYKGYYHLPNAMYMGKKDVAGYKTRYFFRYKRDTGRAYDEYNQFGTVVD